MELKSFQKLLSMLPEGEQKAKLLDKLAQLKGKNASASKDGLVDEFSLQPMGHILIEEIKDGEVVGKLADQANLVVNGAEEIILRAFSGDPNRMLYKNRYPKNDSSSIFHINVNKIMDVVNGQNVIVNQPNVLWGAVDEEEFDVEYSYYPSTVYVEEVASLEPNKLAFVVKKVASANSAPLGSEVYSTFTNMFIGLGNGKNYEVLLDDARLTFSAGFTGNANRKESSTVNDQLSFNQKISNFVVGYEKSNVGGQLQVSVNGSVVGTIETLDSSLAAGVVTEASMEFKVNQEIASDVKVIFSGKDPAVTTPKVAITEIRFDSFNKQDNKLIGEFENFTRTFPTPAVYNTTSTVNGQGTYTVQLPNFPAVASSVKVSYNSANQGRVATLAEVAEGKFFVEEFKGIIHFNRALTNLLISYDVTGELFQDEIASALVAGVITKEIQVASETPAGNVDGLNATFTLANTPVKAGTLVLKVDGTEMINPDNYSVNLMTGVITFAKAPAVNSVIVASYSYTVFAEGKKFVAPHAIKGNEMRVFDQHGKQLTLVADVSAFANGTFMFDALDVENKTVLFAENNVDGVAITKFDIAYMSDEVPGVPTNYRRSVILKPKTVNEYPWFALDKGSVQFVAEFEEGTPVQAITIREMGLFAGPRADDHIRGFDNKPVKAFSLVRVGETRKEANTGIRVTWTITLLNESGQAFKGGF